MSCPRARRRPTRCARAWPSSTRRSRSPTATTPAADPVTPSPQAVGSPSLRGGAAARALADAAPSVFWLDRPDRPAPRPTLDAPTSADLVVVGGGYTGLWTALLAKEADPSRDVLLLEAGRIGWAASGRNGGFCSASLTHGEANGRERWPAEYEQLHRLGVANL